MGKQELVLSKKNDFTTRALVNYLNEKHGSKVSDKSFTTGDIQQYLRRGYLPKKYGHHPIEKIEDKDTGIKIIRVDFSKTAK